MISHYIKRLGELFPEVKKATSKPRRKERGNDLIPLGEKNLKDTPMGRECLLLNQESYLMPN